MSLTPISQYASTASTTPRIRSAASATNAIKTSVRSLGSGQILQANGLSQGLNAAAKSSLNVAYDRLVRQTTINQGANNTSTLQSFLASYVQNSGADASSPSFGTLFKSSA